MTVSLSLAVSVILCALGYYEVRKRWEPVQRRDHKESSSHKEVCIRYVFLILFIIYPDTSGKIFRLLPPACHKLCADISEKNCPSYLNTDYSLECYTHQYNAFVRVAYFGLAFAIGFPLVTWFLLWKYCYKRTSKTTKNNPRLGTQVSKRENQNEIATGMSFIYENYSDNCWFWETVKLVRKLLLTSILVLVGTESRSYIGSAAICSGFYAILYALFKPIPDAFEYWLQMSSLAVTFVNLMIGLMLKIPDENIVSAADREFDAAITAVLLVAANFQVTTIAFGKIINMHISTGRSVNRQVRVKHAIIAKSLKFNIIVLKGEQQVKFWL